MSEVTTLCVVLNSGGAPVAGIQNKLVTGTIIVIHLEKETFVVKNTGNIEKSSEVGPLDGIYLYCNYYVCLDLSVFTYKCL